MRALRYESQGHHALTPISRALWCLGSHSNERQITCLMLPLGFTPPFNSWGIAACGEPCTRDLRCKITGFTVTHAIRGMRIINCTTKVLSDRLVVLALHGCGAFLTRNLAEQRLVGFRMASRRETLFYSLLGVEVPKLVTTKDCFSNCEA